MCECLISEQACLLFLRLRVFGGLWETSTKPDEIAGSFDFEGCAYFTTFTSNYYDLLDCNDAYRVTDIDRLA